MKFYLTKYEPPGRAPCLCGSGIRFKNCCKKEYSKKRFNSRALFNNGEYTGALKSIRSQITWYRLCHMAHTVPFLNSNSDESKNLLRTDIEALSDMTDLLLSCYEKCNIVEEFPKSLDCLKTAINDDRWYLKIDYHRCIYLYVYKNCKEKASVILNQYDWRDLHDVDLLTVYLDIKSDDLNQVDKINVAEKIYDLTNSPSIKLQYGNMAGIQYCLLNDFDKGIPLIEKAISDFEGIPGGKRSAIGRHHLSLSYKQLGELLNNDSYISKSVTGLEKEISSGKYSDLGCSQLLFDLGDCYSHLGELEKSITAYDKSIALNYSDLSLVFKSRVLIKTEDMDKAREFLNKVDSEKLSEPHYFDYVISMCDLAINSLVLRDIDEGLSLIKKIRTNDPLFKDVVQRLLVQLYELKSTCNDVQGAESALKKFNRYVSLKPNLFGVGVDFNAIIDDISK